MLRRRALVIVLCLTAAIGLDACGERSRGTQQPFPTVEVTTRTNAGGRCRDDASAAYNCSGALVPAVAANPERHEVALAWLAAYSGKGEYALHLRRLDVRAGRLVGTERVVPRFATPPSGDIPMQLIHRDGVGGYVLLSQFVRPSTNGIPPEIGPLVAQPLTETLAPAGPPHRLARASPGGIGPAAGSGPDGDVWVALPEVSLRPDNVPLRSRVRLIDLAANGRVRSTTLPLPVPGMPCVALAAGQGGGLLVAGGRGVVHAVATDVLAQPLDRAMRPAGPRVAVSHLAPGAFACGLHAAPRDDAMFEVGMTTFVRSVGAPTSTLLTLRRVSTLGRPLGAPVEVSDALAGRGLHIRGPFEWEALLAAGDTPVLAGMRGERAYALRLVADRRPRGATLLAAHPQPGPDIKGSFALERPTGRLVLAWVEQPPNAPFTGETRGGALRATLVPLDRVAH